MFDAAELEGERRPSQDELEVVSAVGTMSDGGLMTKRKIAAWVMLPVVAACWSDAPPSATPPAERPATGAGGCRGGAGGVWVRLGVRGFYVAGLFDGAADVPPAVRAWADGSCVRIEEDARRGA